MKDLRQLLDKYLNQQLQRIIISNPRHPESAAKLTIRPVLVKNALSFQASEYQEKKVFHKNYAREEAAAEIVNRMEEYRQMELFSDHTTASPS